MNKNAIKTYAIWARNELISRVSQKAYEYGVEKDNIIDSNAESIRGVLLSSEEKHKRQQLIKEINYKGYDQVIEEAAYTWFNRFIALRFMEVNNYLPNKVRLFTNENNEFKPQIIDEALNIDLPQLDKNLVIQYKESNNDEDLYKELLLATCNDMHNYLPGMFKTIDDYMILLFPNNLLREESVLGRLISDIDEESWTDQVQIIGWLYQYYISEKHEEVVDPLHGKTIKKEEVAAATQLFTTDWVVRYMTDNSLGRYWIERNKGSDLKDKLQFYVSSKTGNDQYIDEKVKPEDIKFFDPCMGSGHILVYAFDVFMQIYVSEGWTEREAAISILKNNLYGLDIDERAYQLSYFALMMKARQYNRRILSEGITPNVMAIEESNTLNGDLLRRFGNDLKPLATRLVDIFIDAKEYGSILNVDFSKEELDSLDHKLDEIDKMADYGSLLDASESSELINQFDPLLKQARMMSQKYECVVTNPPYMNRMDTKLKSYVNGRFKDYSADLFSVFIRKNFDFCSRNGYLGFMTPYVWMFIKTYEPIRDYLINNKSICSLIQMEYSAYEEATVPICTFVLSNSSKSIGYYFRLTDFTGGMEIQKDKVLEAIKSPKCNYFFEADKSAFKSIPGSPIAYWASRRIREAFSHDSLYDHSISPSQNITGNNERFVRKFWELNSYKINKKDEWIFYAKGGGYRKWWGNLFDVVNWTPKARQIYQQGDGKHASQIINKNYWYVQGITWGLITSALPSFRVMPEMATYDKGGSTIIVENKYYLFSLGLLNSKIFLSLSEMLNPTLNFQVKDVRSMPIIFSKENLINEIVKSNICQSKLDWDSFETSWDFVKHPLVRRFKTIKESYDEWDKECNDRFNQLKSNEKELNRIFIDIYGLQDELTPEVEDKDVTVRKADLTREIKSLISYAVGCMFGRYSLDTEGLAYAGGDWDTSKYKTYIPDNDNIIPICDDEYFDDDIVARFIEFIKAAYGEDTLEGNLQFIADGLGGKGSSREIIRNYFINDFFNDHTKIYQKRPIYWQFDSGKKNGFKALMYIHRYTPDLIARMRTSYVHEQQSRYRSQISILQNQIDSTTNTSERVKLEKQLKKLKEQEEELRVYEEKVHHYADMMIPMDLDDGVKANYTKFEELLTKIK